MGIPGARGVAGSGGVPLSGLEFIYDTKENEMADVFTATERLCLTEPDEDGNQRLVSEDDPAGRWLFCVPGQELPRAEAEKYGLTDAAGSKTIDEMSGKECDAFAAELEVDGWDAKAKVPAKREALKAAVAAKLDGALANGAEGDDEEAAS